MYKKITKIKKVTTTYSSPEEEAADGEYTTVAETKEYGDTVCMDIAFFVKLLEHVHAKITSSTELQTLAENVVNASKEYPCLTGEWFEKIV